MRASQSRIAFSSIASNTGARSPGEELMTCNTSAVAVCCSNASRVSVDQPRILHRNHRLRGEVLQQRDLLVGKRPTSWRQRRTRRAGSSSRKRHEEDVRSPPSADDVGATGILGSSQDLRCGRTGCTASTVRTDGSAPAEAGRSASRMPLGINASGRDDPKAFAVQIAEAAEAAPHRRAPFRPSRRTPGRGRRARN